MLMYANDPSVCCSRTPALYKIEDAFQLKDSPLMKTNNPTPKLTNMNKTHQMQIATTQSVSSQNKTKKLLEP